MKKSLFLIIIGIIVALTIGFYFFQKNKNGIDQSNTIESFGTTQPTPSKETSMQKDNKGLQAQTLDEVLLRGKNISSVKYEMVTSYSSGKESLTQKVWLKNDNVRTETIIDGQKVIFIVNQAEKTIYQYMPSENIAKRMELDNNFKTLGLSPFDSVKDVIKDIEKYKSTITGNVGKVGTIGKENLNGKNCFVVEYSAGGMSTKYWIWEDKGFPIKMKITVPNEELTVEFKNIEFIDIPNNMFELPAGVEII
jgi:outer membrane lipoprotein-sorting protein